MAFDWEGAIGKNFEAIERIVAGLYALAGIASHRPFVATLPRHLHVRILSVLRPAEYAARRLIAMAACTLHLTAPPMRPATVTPGKPSASQPGQHGPVPERPPAFPLFDPFKPFGAPWLTPEEIAALDNPAGSPLPALPPDDPVGARAVCRRIAALRHALEDLDGQARRLARWRARRSLEASSCSGLTRVRPRRWSPMRPGRPPGWKRRPKTALEEVLYECHFLACDAWRSFDTS